MSTTAYVEDSEFNDLLTYVRSCDGRLHCKIAPFIDQLAEEYEGRAKVVKLDTDKNKITAKKYNIRSIPAVLIFKGGELVENMVGVAPCEKFRDTLEQRL